MKVLKNMYNEYHVPLATCTKREQRVNYQIKKLLRKIKIYTKINNNDICDKKKKNKVLITIITVIIIVIIIITIISIMIIVIMKILIIIMIIMVIKTKMAIRIAKKNLYMIQS